MSDSWTWADFCIVKHINHSLQRSQAFKFHFNNNRSCSTKFKKNSSSTSKSFLDDSKCLYYTRRHRKLIFILNTHALCRSTYSLRLFLVRWLHSVPLKLLSLCFGEVVLLKLFAYEAFFLLFWFWVEAKLQMLSDITYLFKSNDAFWRFSESLYRFCDLFPYTVVWELQIIPVSQRNPHMAWTWFASTQICIRVALSKTREGFKANIY